MQDICTLVDKGKGITTPSEIKGILDTWYKNNLEGKYANYIDGNAGFCGDRRVSNGTGNGTSATDYQPNTRMSNKSPTLSCRYIYNRRI